MEPHHHAGKAHDIKLNRVYFIFSTLNITIHQFHIVFFKLYNNCKINTTHRRNSRRDFKWIYLPRKDKVCRLVFQWLILDKRRQKYLDYGIYWNTEKGFPKRDACWYIWKRSDSYIIDTTWSILTKLRNYIKIFCLSM